MFIVIKNTELGDMPLMIPDDGSFWIKSNLTNKTLKVYVYFTNVTTKEIEYKFETFDSLKEAANDVSRQVLEIQKRTNDKTFFEGRKVI